MMGKNLEQPLKTMCGARDRDGSPCQNPPEPGKRRCWKHGGAPGSGAPFGNQNALKDGFHSAAAIEERLKTRELLAEAEELLARLAEPPDRE
jgi:glucans biosynthesis protein